MTLGEALTAARQRIDRLDARPKVDGTGVYGIDVKLPGLLTAVVVRGPVFGAQVKSLDDRATRARKSVVDVVRIPEGIAVVADGAATADAAAPAAQRARCLLPRNGQPDRGRAEL